MFILNADYAVHENRTKYYQVFSIVNQETGKGCVVTHWGSYTACASRCPKHHAKGVKIDTYTAAWTRSKSNAVKRQKSKRGYGDDWLDYSFTAMNYEKEIFYEELKDWFKDSDAELIISQLGNEPIVEIDDQFLNENKRELALLAEEFIEKQARLAEEAKAQLLKQNEKLKLNENWGMY